MNTVFVHQSKTRQKACAGCVKAKRRCDLLLPSCSRCNIKKQDCVYVNDILQNKQERSSKGSQLMTGPGEAIAVAQPPIYPDGLRHDSQAYDSTGIPILDYHNRQLDLGFTSWNSDFSYSQSDQPLLTINTLELLDPQIFSGPMGSLPSPYASLQYPLRNTLSSIQIKYIVTKLKSFVSAFASHSHNSFIHPLSSSTSTQPLPSSYTDALSVCALHTLKSPQTFSILDSKLSNLISSSERDYWGSYEWLLAVQVLILYQIIRLWSSNERQKLNAERHIQLLMQWTNQLQKEYVELLAQGIDTGLAAVNIGGKKELQNYKRWIFLESIRRTVMISVVLQCLYGGFKNGYIGELLPLLFGLPVSVGGGRAWDALGGRINDEQGNFEGQVDVNVEVGEVYTYEYWSEGWTLGIMDGGEREQDIYERMLLVACPQTGASEKWGKDIEIAAGDLGTKMGSTSDENCPI
ncbi:hypothetical protein MFRU_011g01600 [Monilinia fructicola]|nr:hypothetical protein MFRU_011g01600 [Monilinia fructicola]